MRASRLALGLAVVAPASALLVACGGPSDEERYGDAFTNVAQPLTTELIDLGNAVGSANSSAQVAAALDRVDEALQTASSDFRELDPPDDTAAAQDDLLAELDGFEREVEATRKAVVNGTDGEATRALKTFITESQSFAEALGEINRRLEDAGIPLGEPAASGSA